MRKSLWFMVLFLVLIATVARAYGQGPNLVSEMKASKIVVNEKNREVAVPADKVYPRDKIEYSLRYINTGTAPASGISLIGPIPAGTVYIDQTATDGGGLHPLFSIDGGKTYKETPVKYVVVNEEGEEELRTATPDMITNIKWLMEGTLDTDEEVSVTYRVQVR